MAYRYALSSFALAAALLAGDCGPASAQCRLCDKPTTDLRDDSDGGAIRLEVRSALDFDRLILLGAGDGAATLLPNGERSASGSIAAVSSAAMVGTVAIHGEPNRSVRIELPQRIELFSVGGGRIAIDHLETDLAGTPKLDSAGNLSFRFGGRIAVSGDREGAYRGDVPITVDYL